MLLGLLATLVVVLGLVAVRTVGEARRAEEDARKAAIELEYIDLTKPRTAEPFTED